MHTLVANFSKQLTEAIAIGNKAAFTKHSSELNHVLIAGLGGSGIGGSIVAELTALEATLPVTLCKGYFIPAFVNKHTLVIISSYSGNTEETLNAMEIAYSRGAKLVCVTSGGKVEDFATANKLDLIKLPGGMPPRACLGYSLTQLFFILNAFGVIDGKFKNNLQKAVELIDKEEESIKADAKALAEKLYEKLPVIYATTFNEGIAIRFRQQLNENAKILCWHHVIPEMSHNELVGWRDKADKIAVVLFRDKADFARNQTRIEINKEVFKKYTSNIYEVYTKGESDIEKAIYLIHLGDWISVYLADKRGVDAVEVNVINHLKSQLAKS